MENLKRRMTKTIPFYLLLFIVGLLLVPGLLSFTAIRYLPEEYGQSRGVKPVFGQEKVSGEFTSEKNSLTGIAVSVKNPNLQNKKDIVLNLYQNGNQVRQSVVNGAVIPDGRSVKFIFDPIPDSIGSVYRVEFAASDSQIEEALEIYVAEGEKAALTAYYRPESRVGLTLDVYGEWFKRLAADRGFFVFYSLVFLSTVILAFRSFKD